MIKERREDNFFASISVTTNLTPPPLCCMGMLFCRLHAVALGLFMLYSVLCSQQRTKDKRKRDGKKEKEIRRGVTTKAKWRDEEEEERHGGTARELVAEGAMLQCSGCFPRAVTLLVNKQNTGLS